MSLAAMRWVGVISRRLAEAPTALRVKTVRPSVEEVSMSQANTQPLAEVSRTKRAASRPRCPAESIPEVAISAL